jgi:hypothetical protein
MRSFQIFIAVILLSGTVSLCQAQTENNGKEQSVADTDKIEVYYFHNTRRCETCKAVEAVTRKTLEENFAQQMKAGDITFQSLNIEDEENEPLARKLHVSGQALLFVKDGEKKDLTNEAFMFARSNPDKLKTKIVTTIEKL